MRGFNCANKALAWLAEGQLRRFLVALLFSVWVSTGGAVMADTPAPLEYPVKAAFLYKFALYVEWPEDAFATQVSPVIVGVIGPPELVDQVREAMHDRHLNGRPIEVRQVTRPDLNKFHLLFIARSAQANLEELLDPKARRPLLVVTEAPGALEAGSVINFDVTDERVRFDVNLNSAGNRGLRVSAQLLNVARTVQGAP